MVGAGEEARVSVRFHKRRGTMAIFAAPGAIAAASAIGLGSGLLGVGAWDVVAWIGLGISIVTPICLLYRSR